MSINTTPRTWVAGPANPVTAAQLNTEIRDFATGIQDAWTAWTPTFTNFTQGNGTVTARYIQVGKTITYRILFTAGTTSSFSGTLVFSLPVAIKTDYVAGASDVGSGILVDASAGGSRTIAVAYVNATSSGGTVAMTVDRSGSVANYTSSVNVNSTTPWTWATGDTFSISGEYEAA